MVGGGGSHLVLDFLVAGNSRYCNSEQKLLDEMACLQIGFLWRLNTGSRLQTGGRWRVMHVMDRLMINSRAVHAPVTMAALVTTLSQINIHAPAPGARRVS